MRIEKSKQILFWGKQNLRYFSGLCVIGTWWPVCPHIDTRKVNPGSEYLAQVKIRIMSGTNMAIMASTSSTATNNLYLRP